MENLAINLGLTATLARGMEQTMEALRLPKARVAVLCSDDSAREWLMREVLRTYGEAEIEKVRGNVAHHKARSSLHFLTPRSWREAQGQEFNHVWMALSERDMNLLSVTSDLALALRLHVGDKPHPQNHHATVILQG